MALQPATLRATARVAAFVAAIGSAGLTMRAAYRISTPRLVLILVMGWVLAPFFIYFFTDLAAKRWPQLIRTVLYSVMIIISLGSLAIYIRFVLGPTRAKPAFAFVAVPPTAVLLGVIAVSIAALMSRHRAGIK
jgi:hypothetical protein